MISRSSPHHARIYGEPLAALPQDLYIPPDALEICLETFEGPLDLLLYLIRKHNLDILDIPMAELTCQYLNYVEKMRASRLELAAEYLLMSAMLIEIKSRMLLPRPVEVEQEEDPRAELMRRLLEYESFKLAARKLDEIPQVGREVAVAQAYYECIGRYQPPQVGVEDLVFAWQELLRRADPYTHYKVRREELSVREHMSMILRRLSAEPLLEFSVLFDLREGIPSMVVCFLAILELAREGLLRIFQHGPYTPIYLQAADALV